MLRQLLSKGALAGALALAGSAYGQGISQAPEGWEELVKAAQREGEVNLILSATVGINDAMAAFEKKYGIKVIYQAGSGRQHAERILAERRMGRYTMDAWIGGANTPLTKLIPNDVLIPVDELLIDPDVTDQSNWFQGRHHYTDPEHRYIFTWGASPTKFVNFNTDMVDPEEIQSYWDLLDPKWKGKIVSWSPGSRGDAATSVPMFLNPNIGEEWFRRWANEMEPVIVEDARQGAEWVALGRYPIGLFGLGSQAKKLAAQGFPIQDYLPHPMKEGEVLTSKGANLMALDRAPHPNAMKLFINWALSQEAQQLFLKVGASTDSLRTDVDNSVVPPQDRLQPDAEYSIPFDDPDYINKQGEILSKLRQIMQEAGYK
jgi:iron(III) transport system substrate-binding protein